MKNIFSLGLILIFSSVEFLFPKVFYNVSNTTIINTVGKISSHEDKKILSALNDEDLVLQYLNSIQDHFSSDGWLVPAMEDNSGQTFNNAVTAMAFILKGEKQRAERILDFYAQRIDSSNSNLNSQNFFYKGEARGFFQNINLNDSYSPFICDRWMGDNAWLLLAYKFYEKEYGFADKSFYSLVTNDLKNLLLALYTDDPSGHGGFIQSGWRWGPRNSATPVNDYQLNVFDSNGNPVGHEEGNIDAYAALKLCGVDSIAGKIKQWLDYRMNLLENMPGISLPLDLYSWRSLAFNNEGSYYKNLVLVPGNDKRFRKEVYFNGKEAAGFYSSADSSVQNVWLDGSGHMVCAFYFAGYADTAEYYSNQLDLFLINRNIDGTASLALPYTANKTGGYDWVDINKGFSSSCAWYIFAKEKFNPFTLETYKVTEINKNETGKINYRFEQNYPNPFNPSTIIKFKLPKREMVKVSVFNILGQKIITLNNNELPAGENKIIWNGKNNLGDDVVSGVYIYSIIANKKQYSGKMILLR
jgi:hypothetical protein